MRPKHLIIPDAHAHPDHDNDRFEALGKFILAERPDVIVCIGDFADMPSLSSYDKGTRGFEGRRYRRDVEAATDAQDRLFAPIREYNAMRARNKEKQYKPRWVMCLGNHEDRINRATNAQPELHGAIGVFDLQYEENGWELYDFQVPVVIDGIAYAHYFSSGIKGAAISGEHIGAALCNKLHQSAVQGHSHIYNHAERTRPDGQKIFGLSVGCFSHPDQVEGWNKATQHLWWRGLVILDELDGEGYYDSIQALTLRKLMRDHG